MTTSANSPSLPSNAAEIGKFLDKVADDLDGYKGRDRRGDPRRRMVAPVVALPYDNNREKSGRPLQAVTRDYSEEGIGLLTIRPVTTPQLSLLFQTSGGEEMMIVVDVTRCRRVGIYYDVGCRFSATRQTSD